jgi:sulfate permease, SulP family
MLIESERRSTEEGATVWLAGLSPGVMECVKASGLADRLGGERLLSNARAVIRQYDERFLNVSTENSNETKIKGGDTNLRS